MRSAAAPGLFIYGHAGFDVSEKGARCDTTLGGAAYYAATGASVVSEDVGVVTVVGRDFPKDRFRALGIDCSGIRHHNDVSAVFSQRYNEEDQVVQFSAHLNACAGLSPEDIPENYLKARATFVTTAPPYQQEKVLDHLLRHNFKGALAIDTTMAYVTDFATLFRSRLDRVNFLFVNATEFTALGSPTPKDMIVVVKRGAEGVSFHENGVWRDIRAPHVSRVVSTTGAGDVLAGCCLAALYEGAEAATAIERGVELASRSIEGLGVEHLRQNIDAGPNNGRNLVSSCA